jgi:hypothetical protein
LLGITGNFPLIQPETSSILKIPGKSPIVLLELVTFFSTRLDNGGTISKIESPSSLTYHISFGKRRGSRSGIELFLINGTLEVNNGDLGYIHEK